MIRTLRNPRIAMLIGSASYKKHFLDIEKTLTFKGYIALLPFWHGIENKDSYTELEWEFLMVNAYKKIEIADEVFVVNYDNYISVHTMKEIDYAEKLKKPITYWFKR